MNDYNRIFIVGGKGVTEEEWREAFEPFGNIKSVRITWDRRSGTDRGITYITYEKTSQACLAVQEMNMKPFLKTGKSLKVILASNSKEEQGSRRMGDDDKKLLRLFIVVPSGQDEMTLRDNFEKFGQLDYVRMIKDYKTHKPKGLAYVKYHRQYDAARAVEECDSSYRALFAQEKPQAEDRHHSDRSSYGGLDSHVGGYSDDFYGGGSRDYRGGGGLSSVTPVGSMGSMSSPQSLLHNYSHSNQCSLEALMPEQLTDEHVYRLFDLIPGMTNCVLNRMTGLATVDYSTPQSAAYAKDKVTNMEYPPGYRIAVRYATFGNSAGYNGGHQAAAGSFGDTASALNQSIAGVSSGGVGSSEIQTLVQSIQKATEVLQTAGIAAPSMTLTQESVHYCNIPLPPKKPFACFESRVAERLFIVSQPDTFDESILDDALCRFGNFIEAHFMPGKTFGYAKFATKEAAQEVIKVLHGQQICGNRLKLLVADPPKSRRDDGGPDSKRRRSP